MVSDWNWKIVFNRKNIETIASLATVGAFIFLGLQNNLINRQDRPYLSVASLPDSKVDGHGIITPYLCPEDGDRILLEEECQQQKKSPKYYEFRIAFSVKNTGKRPAIFNLTNLSLESKFSTSTFLAGLISQPDHEGIIFPGESYPFFEKYLLLYLDNPDNCGLQLSDDTCLPSIEDYKRIQIPFTISYKELGKWWFFWEKKYFTEMQSTFLLVPGKQKNESALHFIPVSAD